MDPLPPLESPALSPKVFPFLYLGDPGIRNAYFLGVAGLTLMGYLTLTLHLNLALFAAALLKLRPRALSAFYGTVWWTLALLLVYHESFLPPPSALNANAADLSDFSVSFILDFLKSAVNPKLTLALLSTLVLTALLSAYVRLTVFALGALLFSLNAGSLTGTQAESATLTADLSDNPLDMELPPTEENLNAYLNAFYAHENTRRTLFPATLPSGNGDFDIVLLNICSLASDDLSYSGLEKADFLSRLDITFENFNSATSYSGPATLRLLKSACGQSSHASLYTSRPECELFTALSLLNFKEQAFFDHSGTFGDYLKSLKEVGGLSVPLAAQRDYRVALKAFDGEGIYAASDVFNHYLKEGQGRTGESTLTLMNLIALHDGNTDLSGRPLDFKTRAISLFKDISEFMEALEKSGRKTLLIVIPEHGAALRGDRIQLSRLRDIPSPSLTRVPAGLKFVGLKRPLEKHSVTEPASYQALSELIARILNGGFMREDSTLSTVTLTSHLPVTEEVSENANATVIRYADAYYLRLENRPWIRYRQ